MNQNALLVRYETLAANRRHFENLFFGVTAFSYFFSLALWAAIAALQPAVARLALAAAGAILLGGAFIAHRLMLRERSAFRAMLSSWAEISGDKVAHPQARLRPGAMTIAAAGQALAGITCIAAGAIGLG